MTGLEYLRSLHEVCQFQTREGARVGLASNSELRRWLKQGVVVVNGAKLREDDKLPYPVQSMYMFPNRRITMV